MGESRWETQLLIHTHLIAPHTRPDTRLHTTDQAIAPPPFFTPAKTTRQDHPQDHPPALRLFLEISFSTIGVRL